MASYYVNQNAQPNGDHEVHTTGCNYMPNPENRTYLGEHTTCHTAVTAAKKHYTQVNGCIHCSYACHTQQHSPASVTLHIVGPRNIGSAPVRRTATPMQSGVASVQTPAAQVRKITA